MILGRMWKCISVLFATIAFAQTAPTATAVSTAPVFMDEKTLAPLYQHELGAKFDPAKLHDLYQAHKLIEQYFSDAPGRKATVAKLEATGIEPNILGRLCRIRMTWPQLQAGVYYINERVGPHFVKYFLGIPKDYDRGKSWPLVVKLPATDEFVRDPKPTADMITMWYTNWMADELKRHPDAIVIMPLLNLDELYGPSYAGMHTVIQPMLHACERTNVDTTRVYLIGHSMSASATWNIGLHYPTYLTAINPLAGGAKHDWQRVRMMNLRNILSVPWHDVNDEVIKVDSTRALVRILKNFKIDVDYEETKKQGHTPTEEIYDRCYQKMRQRTRDLYPKRVTLQSNRPDTMFNRIDWVQQWQPVNSGTESWLILSRGHGHMVVYQNTFKTDATLTGMNRIDATTDNVASLRFYLNDQMVDFSKPVTVNVNKKGFFEAMVKPGVELMLKDQIFMGRGWRYFTGVVDIDIVPRPATAPSTGPTTR